MQLDHLSYAAGPEGMATTAERLSDLLGEKFLDGGVHPRFGTSNMVMPLTGRRYLEIVEVLDHPSSDKALFGQAVRARTAAGGGWLGWVVRVDDIAPVEARLGRSAVQGNRHRPDGVELRWQQIGLRGLVRDPQLPFFVAWEAPAELHPSAGATGDVSLTALEIAGNASVLAEWLDMPVTQLLDEFEITWVTDRSPGLVAVSFTTPDGIVRI